MPKGDKVASISFFKERSSAIKTVKKFCIYRQSRFIKIMPIICLLVIPAGLIIRIVKEMLSGGGGGHCIALLPSPLHVGWQHKKRSTWVWKITKLNAVDCCQTTTNEKQIYFPTNSCKLHNRMGSSKILYLKSALLGKMHAVLQDVLTCSPISNDRITRARPNEYLSCRLLHGLFAL